MSNGKLRRGQQLKPSDTGPVVQQFTEQVMDDTSADALLGNVRTEIIPGQAQDSLVRVYTSLGTALSQTVKKVAGVTNMNRQQLPDQIVGFTITFNKNEQTGESVQDENAVYSTGVHGSLSPNASARASASAAVVPDLQVGIKETPGSNLPCTHAFFYMQGNVTQAQILTRLSAATGNPSYGVFGASVNAWPLFFPKSLYFTLKGQQVAVLADAQAEMQASWDTVSYSRSYRPAGGGRADGYSRDVGISNRSLVVPPTIHPGATLTFSTGANVGTASVDVRARLTAISGTVSISAIDNHPAARTAVATADITPLTYGASTSYPAGITAIPTSGLYMVEFSTQFSEFDDYSFVHAVVIDASIFA